MSTNNMKKADCLPCRLSGGAVGLGVGYFSLRKANQMTKSIGYTNKTFGLGLAGVSKFIFI
jgi:hypothetical protein